MMKYEITTYNFFKVGNDFEFVKDGKRFSFTAEMMTYMLNQYKMMGFRVVFDNDCVISVARVENEIEIFLEKLANRG